MVVIRLLATVSDELVDGKEDDGEAGYPSYNDHHCIHPAGIWDLLRFGELRLEREPQVSHEGKVCKPH